MRYLSKVNVILSTYNGEKYLEDLLQSLIAQTYRNIEVWIRDDGSNDQTVQIIKEYCKKKIEGIQFHYVEDNLGNLKPTKSFFQTLMASGDADYYAFCDQDDIWYKEKIQRAVDVLRQQPKEKCFLYASGYDICDSDLNKVGVGKKTYPLKEMSVGKAFFNYGAGLGQGFTLVFNHALKKYAFHEGYTDIRAHDVWLWAVIAGMGTGYYYDDYSTALYRRHSETVTPTGKEKWRLWKWRWQNFLSGDIFDRNKLAIRTFTELFGKDTKSKEDRDFLELFGNLENQWKNRLSKALFRYRLKPKLLEELALRFAFLCGKG